MKKVENQQTGEKEWRWVPVNLPSEYPNSYCAWGVGEWWAPDLRAVVEHPVLFADGSVLSKRGYHPKSRLYLDSSEHWELPPAWPKHARIDPLRDEQIQWAVGVFEDLFWAGEGGETRFSPATREDFAAMVAMILTGLVKTEIGPAPGFVITAPVMGSGKGKLADVVSIVLTGRKTPMQTMPVDKRRGVDEVKFGEQLFAALFGGAGLVVIDEVPGKIDSATLRTMLTQEEFENRIKGYTKMGKVRCVDSMFILLGNHVTVGSEDARRLIRVFINTKSADPHKRRFKRDALRHAAENRVRIVRAGLTLLQGYMAAGSPDQGIDLGSYERWAALVPSAIHWAGIGDPCKTMEAWLERDVERQRLGQLLEAWHAEWPDKPMTVKGVCKALDDMSEPERNACAALVGVVEEICWEAKKWNTRRLGNYIADRLERHQDGFWFEKRGEEARAARYIVVREK